jgi:hypothetical protein
MNVKLKVLTAAMLAGFVGSAASAPIPGTPPPPVLAGGIVPGTAGAPTLSVPEMAAYTAIETILEAVEGQIYARSCAGLKGTHLLSVHTDKNGTGTAELVTPAGFLEIDVEKQARDPLLGWAFDVDINGGNTIAGAEIKQPFDGDGNFDRKGGIMTHEGNFKVYFPLTNKFVELEHKVIKDFRWVRSAPPAFVDYGLQSVAKKGNGGEYYPQAKWWQTSRHVRSNGVEGVTRINKERLYNANGNSACSIVVELRGFDDFDGFNQDGTLIVKTAKP